MIGKMKNAIQVSEVRKETWGDDYHDFFVDTEKGEVRIAHDIHSQNMFSEGHPVYLTPSVARALALVLQSKADEAEQEK